MSALHRFRRADLTAQPWKNGGGVTREIVSWPPGSGTADFDWRVSIAHIASSGPFSAFPGVDRVITLLDGSGVALQSADGAVNHQLDQPLQPFFFQGEVAVHAQLLGPDCHDFNVMTRRVACTASVQVVNHTAQLPPQSQGLLFCTGGQWLANEQTLVAGDGLWWSGAPLAWTLAERASVATLIVVLIQCPP